jgi:predicted anti-sigma-YlaC factor YlaD
MKYYASRFFIKSHPRAPKTSKIMRTGEIPPGIRRFTGKGGLVMLTLTSRNLLLMLFLTGFASACSVRKVAIKKLGDALAEGGSTFASDDDPELVRSAVPFSLKLMESLLAESPRHKGLLLAAARGFTQYAYAFVQEDADEMETRDLAVSLQMRTRARRLYLRARKYGLRGLEVNHPGFEQSLRADPPRGAAVAGKADVPLLYWTAASWGSAISLSKDDPALVAEQPMVEALIDRALSLDETFDEGAIHSFLITYEMARQGAAGDPAQRARMHFARAMELSGGHQAAPLVALAEAVSLSRQDRREFKQLLDQALAIDPDAWPEDRLVNLVMQRRARWLLSRIDELFLDSEEGKP